MQKKLLLVMNPFAGIKRANRFLTDILTLFSGFGWDSIVHMTTGRGDGRVAVEENASGVSLVVCIGGDGTFNECVDGLLNSRADIPLGYIPAGSTNDFANSLHLSKNILHAAKDIMEGTPRSLDVGEFNGRHFTYISSFGAFTKTSYTTPQNAKNALGHLAYLLEGLKDISQIKPLHLRFETGNEVYEDDYIFGAVSNSTSVAGILTISPDIVDMNDGRFELLLVKNPDTAAELNECLRALTSRDYSSPMISFFSADRIRVTADPRMDWTLDGEWQQGAEHIDIRNIHNAIRVITREKHGAAAKKRNSTVSSEKESDNDPDIKK